MFAAQNGFPKMKGKAAELAHIGEPLLLLWRDHMDSSLQTHRMVAQLLEHSVSLERIVRENAGELPYPAPIYEELLTVGAKYAAVLTFLGQHYHEIAGAEGEYWNYTIKTHELQHCCFYARWIKTSRSWCYQGEDAMLRSRHIISSCCKGFTKKHQVTSAALMKYWRGKNMDLLALDKLR